MTLSLNSAVVFRFIGIPTSYHCENRTCAILHNHARALQIGRPSTFFGRQILPGFSSLVPIPWYFFNPAEIALQGELGSSLNGVIHSRDHCEATILNIMFLKNTVQLTAYCIHHVSIQNHTAVFRPYFQLFPLGSLSLLFTDVTVFDHSTQRDIPLACGRIDVLEGGKGIGSADDTCQHRCF